MLEGAEPLLAELGPFLGSSTRSSSASRRPSGRSPTSSPTARRRCRPRRRRRAAASATTCASSARSAPRAWRSTRSGCPPTAATRTSTRWRWRRRQADAGAVYDAFKITPAVRLPQRGRRAAARRRTATRAASCRARTRSTRRRSPSRARSRASFPHVEAADYGNGGGCEEQVASGGSGGAARAGRARTPSSTASASAAWPSMLRPAGRRLGAERLHPGGHGAAHARVGLASVSSRSVISTWPSASVSWKRRSGSSPRASTTSSTVPLSCGPGVEHPGREAEDRADVDVLARARGAPGPVVAPAGERAEHGHQLARALGQLVVHARRHLAVALARQQAVGDHAVQARAQLLGRDAGQHALELDEAPRAGGEIADDQQRPLVADEVERAGVGRPLVVGMALGGRNGRDGDLRNSRDRGYRGGAQDSPFPGGWFRLMDIWRIDPVVIRLPRICASSSGGTRLNEW